MSRFHAIGLVICSLSLMAVMFIESGAIALAQVGSSISGRIDDSSGAPVANVNVTAKNLETGASRSVTTDNDGNYQVLALPVGQYEVRAENAGFKAAIQTGITLSVGQQAVVNLKLEVGTVREQVTVTGDAALVNTTTSSIAGLVGEKDVKDLPLNGRSFDQLIMLNPGTVNFTVNKGGPPGTGGNLFSVAGRRGAENLTLMNGVEYTGAGNASVTPGGVSGFLMGIDAVREYNVLSDGYGAEYGKRAGAQVSVVTQSGTNQLHGTLFEFLRNDKLNAREFFAQGVPPFKRNQFGGALGGPIRKDKTFIFGNYEGYRQSLGLSIVTFVPDANARLGLLPCGASPYPPCAAGTAVGTPTKAVNLDTRILPFLNGMWPQPDPGPSRGGGVALSHNSPNATVRQDFGTTRFDQVFSTKDTLSGVYTIDDGYSLTPGQVPLFGIGLILQSQTASLQETHIFSPTVINTFTAGYSRGKYHNEASAPNLPASLSFVANHSPGAITIGNVNTSTGFDMPGNQNPFVIFYRNLFTYSDGVQVIKGKHQISAGVWFQRIQDNDNYPLRASGSAAFATIPSFLTGMTTSFQVAPKTTANGWRSWEGAWYVQDSIQLRPNLTVRVGLRHEFSNGWSEVNGIAQTILFDQGVIQTLPRTSSQFNTENNSKWLFGPRVSLAWDPFGKGKTSIRAAFGTYYDQHDALIYFVDQTPPLNGAATFGSTSAPVSLFTLIPFDTTAPLKPPCSPGVPTSQCNIYAPKGVQSNYKVPTVEAWNLSLEQQLARATALRLGYTGSHTYHQWVTIDPNTIQALICSNAAGCLAGGVPAFNAPTNASLRSLVPVGTAYVPVANRPNPFLGSGFFALSQGYGNYNALQVEVIQRLSQGMQFRGSFTWAKNLDSGSGPIGGGTGSSQGHLADNRQDYGLANFGIRAQARGNFSYQLPFGQGKHFLNGVHGVADKLVSGWQVNSIVSLLSGFPFSVTAGSNVSGNGDANGTDRPNLAPGASNNPVNGVTAGCGGGIIPAGQQLHTPNLWFDPCAFVQPAPGTFGNAGRNTMIGPGLATVDFSLFKNTKITERIGLQFRAEGFNILNHSNFRIPQSSAVLPGGVYSPSAGIIQNTATSARQIQFGLKLTF